MELRKMRISLGVILLVMTACMSSSEMKIDYEKITLENGLDLILHEDKSDPIVAVAIQLHVGSNREKPGRTGFAHLFEHILFQESEHVGQDQFFKNIQAAGGTLNGGTGQDGTIYYEVVPKNALEMVLWMESDRMGFLLGKVTQEAFENQQSVVSNEKRQRVDNNAYGHTNYLIGKNLYPPDHPYNWQVIGSLDDLANASLEDVRDFFLKWYGPNNATLVIAGDYDREETIALVKKYFGEIKSSTSVPDPKPWPVTLDEIRRVYHEDNFAKSPELRMVYPTIEQYTNDAYALRMLGALLSDGKKAPLYKVIVEEKKLAPSISAFQRSSELAGEFRFQVRTFPGIDLTSVEEAIYESLARFEEDSFTEQDMDRLKAGLETSFYNGISSILGKSFQLARYNEYAGSPGFITQDIQAIKDVTQDDVWRVYNQYIKDKNFVQTSFVPKGENNLIADGAIKGEVVEEAISALAEAKPMPKGDQVILASTPSSFDRTTMPAFGPDPLLAIPSIWHATFDNGMKMSGIIQDEVPLIQFTITLRGGKILDPAGKGGVANLMTDIMMEGTRNRTPLELEEAIDNLGARISMFTSSEFIRISANTLTSKFDETYALVEELLLEPRWDEKEFIRLKAQTIEGIKRRKANPSSIASLVYSELVYGKDHILAKPTSGTVESVDKITIDDLKAFYEANYSPSVTYISVVGNISAATAEKTFGSLASKWADKQVDFPTIPEWKTITKSALYFVDVPGAKQSQIRIGHTGPKYTDKDYYSSFVMNYRLGGSFNSILNMILREEKGYTYGARSGFSGGMYSGTFTASSGVQSNATLESMIIFKDELTNYVDGIEAEDLTFTKNALVKSNARAFETLGALLRMVNTIGAYGLPDDYVKDREDFVKGLTADQHQELAKKYIQADKMVYLVVGDAATQLDRLKDLGLGEPILIDNE